MNTLLIMGIIAECGILAVLTILKKWTKKTFLVIAFVTAAGCALIGILGSRQKATERVVNQKAYLYMASRLIQEDFHKESLEALSNVRDDQCEAYESDTVRALAYNLNEAYEVAAEYLKTVNDSNEKKLILESSMRSEAVDKENSDQIAENTLRLIDASESETRQWDAEMKVRYMGFDLQPEEKAVLSGKLVLAKQAISENRFEDAYRQFTQNDLDRTIENAIIVSNMYVKNYNRRIMSDTDAEYAQLWNEVTALQAELNLAALDLQGKEADSSEYKEYKKVKARYDLAMESLNQEAVKRAVNYLKTFEKTDVENGIAYQMQMARLYFMSNQIEPAREALRNAFATDEINCNQWLGRDAEAFRQAYIIYISNPVSSEYSLLFDQLIGNLYQGLFEQDDYGSFKEFVMDYLHDLYSGLTIRKIDASGFPRIVVDAAVSREDIILDNKNLKVTDTDEMIKEFQIDMEEIRDLNLCFVLDKSGSMQGNKIVECKNAIKNSIAGLMEDVSVSLVTFDNTAAVDCNITQSKYLVMNLVEGVQATGGTNIASGLMSAREALNAAGGSRVIILLSDGVDNETSQKAIDGVLAEILAEGIVVYTIGLPGSEEAYLQNIANKTGGQYIMVNNTAELNRIYQEIQTSLMKKYTITYVANGEEENRYLSLKGNSSYMQARKTYSTMEHENENRVYVDRIQEAGYYKQTGGTGNRR